MPATYVPADASTKASAALRLEVGDTNLSKPLLDDEEVKAFLKHHGLLDTSDPVANWRAVLLASARAAEAIAAKLSQKSEITIGQFGAVKSTAAREYRELAKRLRGRAASTAKPHFFNPSTFPTTHVAGIDPDPDEE